MVASPDLPVRLGFFDLAADPERPVVETEARFEWAVENEAGLYVAPVDFGRAGDWGVEVVAGRAGSERTVRARFEVKQKSLTPSIGARAPASETPTGDDLDGVRRISTDPDPDPDFYRLSVEEAVASGMPSVVVFSTPAFCRTRTCGPALEVVKEVAGRFKGRVNFVHVEPYRLRQADGHLQPEVDANGQFRVVRAVEEWNLPTEPYIFVIAPDATVSAKFEGIAGREELEQAISRVAG